MEEMRPSFRPKKRRARVETDEADAKAVEDEDEKQEEKKKKPMIWKIINGPRMLVLCFRSYHRY